jgi:predicted MFS family arabinose efflux permease
MRQILYFNKIIRFSLERTIIKRALSAFTLIVFIALCLWTFEVLSPTANAQQTLFNDNFSVDSSLNSGIWMKNGPSGTEYFERLKIGLLLAGVPSFDLVDPNPTFSSSGMSISSIDGPWKMTTIESINTFSAPIALQVSVSASKGGGAAFCMWLRDDPQHAAVGLCGVLNPEAPDYGIWSFRNSRLYNQRLLSSPQLNTVYQLTITVNSAGEISLSLSSNGQSLGSVSEQSIGTGPFKIVLAQYEVGSESTGTGPNEAYWKIATLTSNAPTNTPSPSPSITITESPTTSPTPSSTIYSNSTPTASVTSPQVTPSNVTPNPLPETSTAPPSSSPTSSTTPTQAPINSPSSSASDEPTSMPYPEATFNLTGEFLALVIVAPSLAAALAFLICRSKKIEKDTPIAYAKARATPSKPLLLGLLAAVFSVNIIDIFVPLLRTEIARTFGIGTSTALQLSAFNALAGVLTGLVLSAISIRVKYKKLLMFGVFCTVICTLGVFLAPNFLLMQIFYTLNGIGSVTVFVMAQTLIGELYPQDKKAKRISWILATGQVATLFGSPIIGSIADIGGITGWRNALLWFQLPATIICLLLVFVLIPNRSLLKPLTDKKEPFMSGFKEVLTNKSAVACIVSTFLGASIAAVNALAPAFVAEVYNVTPFLRGLIPVGAFSLLIAGLLIGGFIANRVGRKRLTVMAGMAGIVFAFMGFPISLVIPNFFVYLGFRFTAACIGGIALVATPLLSLDQVPNYRGTMMSLVSTSSGLGFASAMFMSSAILRFIDNPPIGYPVATVVLGVLGIISSIVIFFFAKDPLKDLKKPPKEASAEIV